MTYSLDTLNSRNSLTTAPVGGVKRFAHEVGLMLGGLGLVFWLAALASYSAQDAAWSTTGAITAGASGGTGLARNMGGKLGAFLADGSYFLFGFSVWWLWAAGARRWLLSLVRWLGGSPEPVREGNPVATSKFWVSLVFLIVASAAL